MSDFLFLDDYRGQEDSQNNDLEHVFYPLSKYEIKKAEDEFGYELPSELKDFYLQIGYGFFHKSLGEVNRLMDTTSLYQINLKQDEFENDPDLEVYDDLYNGEKLLFFEINEGVYLAIDKADENGKNKIYYMDSLIADSLEHFIKSFIVNPEMINEL
ncbi:SMI1/KNR4 family protein [Pedobacter alluvionis]|uniref:SMI1/KNR4 family protein n=1 Tax=Pedobacter alluvionis TaxID=475253 RepID=A0A497XYG7_9SPHI|nr:SMI1/KNR4 family protein [Pedobacter alluvionis]RLJ75171.1 SUKH superfamily protein [Pedobacter alluvionis]TFB30271.1 SMI1/KNR4 family protein [Pedobacter alluvionis]